MGSVKTVVPSVSLHVEVRENVDSIEGAELLESSVLELGLEKLRLVVEEVFVELGSTNELFLSLLMAWDEPSNLAYTEIVVAVLKSFRASITIFLFKWNISKFYILLDCAS